MNLITIYDIKSLSQWMRARHHRFFTGWELFSILIFLACDKQPVVVAEFGQTKITISEFSSGYLQMLKQPDSFDSPEIREAYLDELITQHLFAEQAKAKGMAESELFHLQLTAYQDKCLRDAHFREIILPQIYVSEDEVQKVYSFTTQKRKIRHLFCEGKSQADSLYHLLQQGADWNKLAAFVFHDEKLAVSGGDLGWVNWDQLEYDMAMTAFCTSVQRWSKPVKSSWGYHIIQVDDFEINPLITEDEYQSQAVQIRYMIEKKKGDKIASEYLSQLIGNVKIQIHPEVMQLAGRMLEKIFRQEPSQFHPSREIKLSPQENQQLEQNLWDYRQEVLAIIDGKELTIGRLMGLLKYVPYEASRHSFKTALDFAIRDFVLTEEAREMSLQKKDPAVEIKTSLFETELLQRKYRQYVMRNVKLTEEEKADFYSRNKSALYSNQPMEEVSELIWNQLLNQKKLNVLADTINILWQRQKVIKHPEPIHEYYEGMIKN